MTSARRERSLPRGGASFPRHIFFFRKRQSKMKQEIRKEFSRSLNREMEYAVYGDAGKICLVFPSQNGRFHDFEHFGMVEMLRPEIESGKLQLVCADGIDGETWSNAERPPRERIETHETWFRYVMDELVPRAKADNPRSPTLMTTGCSMGGFHAANFFFRAPQVFDTVIALSGVYEAGYFFGGYMDDLVYLNSPVDSLANMPLDHTYLEVFRRRRLIFCVGQGAWEEDLLKSTRRLEDVLRAKNVPAWFDYWGFDVSHDWVWWRRQIRYFVERLGL